MHNKDQNIDKNKNDRVCYIIVAVIGVLLIVAIVVFIIVFIQAQSNNNGADEPDPCFVESNGKFIFICDDYKKPIIYLYPEQTTEVTVKLGYPEKLTTTYPDYADGWKVLAEPSGALTDLKTGRSQYALYWEGSNYFARIHDKGFVIKGEDTAKFLEEKLSILGLSEREANEFIIYWLPKMQHNPYNYIYFATPEEINEYMPMEVTPQPDTIIRVMMEFKPLQFNMDMQEQTLPMVRRKGFTVVEWGGSDMTTE